MGPDDPLLPAQGGGFMPKHAVIHKFRQVLQAAGVELTYTDPKSRLQQLFSSHAARVAGASFLAAHSVPTPVIQLLRQWTAGQRAPGEGVPDVVYVAPPPNTRLAQEVEPTLVMHSTGRSG